MMTIMVIGVLDNSFDEEDEYHSLKNQDQVVAKKEKSLYGNQSHEAKIDDDDDEG